MLISFYIMNIMLMMTLMTYIFIYPMNLFMMNCRVKMTMNLFLFMIMKMFNFNQKNEKIFFMTLLMFIYLTNFNSLNSFIFAFSSLPFYCFNLGLFVWSMFMIKNIFNNLKPLISHLVPENCPFYLIFLMVLIETISQIIRWITLSVRLMANITAGHLLMILVKDFILSAFILMILELVVSLIQAFVFSLLSSLYNNESN